MSEGEARRMEGLELNQETLQELSESEAEDAHGGSGFQCTLGCGGLPGGGSGFQCAPGSAGFQCVPGGGGFQGGGTGQLYVPGGKK